MKKELKLVTEYRRIAESNYILLHDGRVAKLLTPTRRNELVQYNLFIPAGCYRRLTHADIEATIKAGEVTKSADAK
jgi:hypothetical protein